MCSEMMKIVETSKENKKKEDDIVAKISKIVEKEQELCELQVLK